MAPAERDLRAEHTALRAERDRLRDELAPPGYLPASLGLSENEGKAFKALLSRDQWTKDSLLASIYYDVPVDDVPEIKIIDVIICKLRAKLTPLGIEIQTFWNKGYRMPPHMRLKAARLIDTRLSPETGGARPAAMCEARP